MRKVTPITLLTGYLGSGKTTLIKIILVMIRTNASIKIDNLEKAKTIPCIFNNWANFYKGKFISNTILNANSFEKLIKE